MKKILLLILTMVALVSCNQGCEFTNKQFESPNSEYKQAGHLYDRYCEHFGIKNKWKNRK